MSGLYQSGFAPKGVKKTWERCAFQPRNVAQILGRFHDKQNSEVKEAVCWLDEDGELRRFVADYHNGRRIDVSLGKRGGSTVRFLRDPEWRGGASDEV